MKLAKRSREIYLEYWKRLKAFVDEQGLDWKFSSLEGESEIVVKIGPVHEKRKITLSLISGSASQRPQISAGFWIPDSREDFELLKSNRARIEAEMGKPLVWDSKPGRKSSWVRVTTFLDLSKKENWSASFAWFAENAGKIRDACGGYLG